MKRRDEKSSGASAAILDEGTESLAEFDVERVRAQFPILKIKVHGKPLVYLDNGATTQKPRVVIDAIRRYYESENANIHRGVHTLSQEATAAYELARKKVARFINAAEDREIIFTRGTTESINLVASSYGGKFLKAGDEIILSAMEHHSNIVPWQLLAERTGAKIRVIPMNDRGELAMDEFDRMLNDRTKIVSIVHLSNSLGTINPVRQIIEKAHARGAVVMVDGAQWVGHAPLDVRKLDADFYAFSGHKLYGPTGVGVLYGKAALLEAMPPYQGGGDMISSVTFEKTTYAALPHKFEAGTPNIAGGIGLGAAIDFVNSIGLENIARHEGELLEHGTRLLSQIPGVRIMGTAREKAGVISFIVDNPPMAALDVGMRLDADGIAVRTGHHCCQPVMDRLKIAATARASLAMYNTKEEIETLAASLRRIVAAESTRLPADPAPAVPEYPTPQAAANELIETFDFLEDWEQRYELLNDLGEKLPPMPEEMKNESNLVKGCQSIVYLVARKRPNTPDTIDFLASSDAIIVRGLVALLLRVFSGQSAKAILAFDDKAFIQRLGLDKNTTMFRRTGLEGMIRRIRAETTRLADQ
jgi:cysteine desulfurase/selenocysteine lyase